MDRLNKIKKKYTFPSSIVAKVDQLDWFWLISEAEKVEALEAEVAALQEIMEKSGAFIEDGRIKLKVGCWND